MEFSKVIKERYSVRKYKPDMILDDELNRILEAGMLAPTGCNYQPQRIYVLKSEEAIAKIRSLTRCAFDAPIVLIIALDEASDWKSPLEAGCRAGVQDVSIVADHMMLAAWEIGIGSCWVNYFKPSEVKSAFDLPENETPVLLMTLGYPANDSKPAKLHSESKNLNDIVKML
ncbi:MAG: nitroreductase family protein [Ruminococcus sp.]|nr:nitroreductase family protein [Ruminococcus sp.]